MRLDDFINNGERLERLLKVYNEHNHIDVAINLSIKSHSRVVQLIDKINDIAFISYYTELRSGFHFKSDMFIDEHNLDEAVDVLEQFVEKIENNHTN